MNGGGLRGGLVWAHRWMGLISLAFLAVAAVTGCILCFVEPLDALLNPELFRAPHPAAVSSTPAVTALIRQHPEVQVLAYPTTTPPGRSLRVSVAGRGGGALGFDEMFLDPRDGHVLGVRRSGPAWSRQGLMAGVYSFHYTLLGGVAGRWIMGVAAVSWLVGNLVGGYLTLPARRPFLPNWWKLWTFRWKSALPRLFLDLHRASGLWLFIPITILAFTSVAMNFFDEAFTPAVQALSPGKASPFAATPPPGAAADRLGFAAALEAGRRRAKAAGSSWAPSRLSYIPQRNLYGVGFTPGGTGTYLGLGPVTYWYDGGDGRLAYEDNPYTDSAGQKLSRSLYPLHTGQMIGWTGVALDLVLGVVTFEMCVTGAYVWWRRRGPRIAARRANADRKVAA